MIFIVVEMIVVEPKQSLDLPRRWLRHCLSVPPSQYSICP